MVAFQFGPFVLGNHTLWLCTHGLLMVVALIVVAFLCGVVGFDRPADERLVRALKWLGALGLVAMVALMVTGLVPDVDFDKGQGFSGSFHTGFGTFQASVTDDNLGAFTGPLLFDMMEHVSFVVPGLAALLCFLIWHYGRRVIEDRVIRGAAVVTAALMVGWVLVIGSLGVYVTRILTFPYTR